MIMTSSPSQIRTRDDTTTRRMQTVRIRIPASRSYVLVETDNPDGYATADPILIEIEDTGTSGRNPVLQKWGTSP